MTTGSGLANQIGIVKESVYNTPVAVSTFTGLLNDTLDTNPEFAVDMGLMAGKLVVDVQRRVKVFEDAAGEVEFNVPSKGMGRWLAAATGTVATPTQIATSGVYTAIFNLASTDGVSWTIQKGIASTDGTVNPFTLSGCKIAAWELSAAPGGLLKFKATIDAAQVQLTGAGALGLQAASYPALTNWGSNQVTVQQFTAMTVVSNLWTPTSPTSLGVVRNITIKGGTPKDTARKQLGSLVKAEQLVNNWTQLTGQIDIDYASNSLYTLFEAGTSTGIFVNAQGSAVIGTSGTNVATLGCVMPAVVFEKGATPKSNGPGVVTVSYPFTAYGDGTNGAMQIYTLSTDSAL